MCLAGYPLLNKCLTVFSGKEEVFLRDRHLEGQKPDRRRRPMVPAYIKFLALLIHFVGLLIVLLQQPEFRELLHILLIILSKHL